MKSIKTRISLDELQAMKSHTMGCWWPNRGSQPDWCGIAGELDALVKEEEFYFSERGSDLARLQELRKLQALAKDKTLGR